MGSLIPGYNYDIFISYRQKDNKGDRWVSEFVEALKSELESTFKEDIGVYFDIDSHDGLLETHDVDASLKDKLKCLIFIPIISRTYCDPKSFAWGHEFKAFIDQASKDQFGLKVKLPNGNVATRILPIQIHDLYNEDKAIIEKEMGGVLRAIEFIYKEPGVNRPLTPKDSEEKNSNKTNYRNQINKVANAIDEIIHCLKGKEPTDLERKASADKTDFVKTAEDSKDVSVASKSIYKYVKWLIISILLLICIVGANLIYKGLKQKYLNPHPSNLEKSIAVLPFVNDSPDKDNEYFCNGMMEEILNQLQKIGDLKVKARTSIEKYRNTDKDIITIGKELNVSLIMEGSVRKAGDDLRINTQLIDAKTGDHLWSEIYDGKYTTEIFEFQTSVAKKVAESLNAVITPQEGKRLNAKPVTNLFAYDLSMKGNEFLRKYRYTRDSSDLRLAFKLLNEALKIDPEFITPISCKAEAFTESGDYDSAIYYHKKVYNLDPDHMAGLAGIGAVYFYSNKPDSAFKYLQLAVDKNPNDPWSNLALGQIYYLFRDDPVKSLFYIYKSYVLAGDSYSEINDNLAWVCFSLGEYQKSIKYIRNAISLRSECQLINQCAQVMAAQKEYDQAFNFLDSICNLTKCEQSCEIMKFYLYTFQNEFEKAMLTYNKALNSGHKQNDDDDIYLSYLYKKTGKDKEAFSILRNAVIRNNDLLKGKAPSWQRIEIELRLAAALTLLGENKKALQYLSEVGNRAIFTALFNINVFPGYDYLRNDPEFEAIVKRMEDKQDSLRALLKEMELRGEINL